MSLKFLITVIFAWTVCILFHTAIWGLGLGLKHFGLGLGLTTDGLGLGLDTADLGLGLGTVGLDYKSDSFNFPRYTTFDPVIIIFSFNMSRPSQPSPSPHSSH